MMLVETLASAKLGRDVSPFQCQQMLELVHKYGEEKFIKATEKLRPCVTDPVSFLHAVLSGRKQHSYRRRKAAAKLLRQNGGIKICRDCNFKWDSRELLVFVCPRCKAHIVSADGISIDPAKYSAYMRIAAPVAAATVEKQGELENIEHAARANVIGAQRLATKKPPPKKPTRYFSMRKAIDMREGYTG